ncbi:MAG: N-sulfoglucosamine sulfohydrolase [Planctomycetota bacterium]|jgi:N-sulfoglucosamine sulfohydrolase
MNMTRLVSLLLALLFSLTLTSTLTAQQPAPNILWIFVEDMNDWFGCTGDELVKTPNIDKLAASGVRFNRAYMPAGVCSPTRSAVITGCWQTTIGAHNHRSSRGDNQIDLPKGVRPLPALMREHGYYTFNYGKTDYNFRHKSAELYDWHKTNMNFDKFNPSHLWLPSRKANKPFFGQIQLRGGKNRSTAKVDPSKVKVPPYYPDTPVVREEIAHHYDVIQKTDREVGKIIKHLLADGMYANTVVFFFSDHGYRMHRHKQFLYEGGVRVPCMVAGPNIGMGVRDDLISGIDLAATTLQLAGITRPNSMQGRDIFGDKFSRKYVISARDRCDYSIDKIRAVTTERYKYIRNYLTDRPYMQPQYRDAWRITKQLHAAAKSGDLNKTQMQFYGDARPAEEFYDLKSDPHQIRNLAESASVRAKLDSHRQLLADWIEQTGDLGQEPESEASLRDVLERWKDKCVNPEFRLIRERVATENASKHRVLILGDSISIGYTPIVKKLMKKDTWVMRPKENCAGTTKGVANIDRWLQIEGGKFDVIWFNFGLHDLKRVLPNGKNSNNPEHQRQAEPAAYEKHLRTIVKKLKATGATLIFATTTPIPAGGVRPHRDLEDPERYNAIARSICKDHGIEVHDLYGLAMKHQKTIQPRVDVHFTKEGSALLGRHVAEALRASLAR